LFQEGVKPSLLKKREKIIMGEIYEKKRKKERKEEGKSERATAPHT